MGVGPLKQTASAAQEEQERARKACVELRVVTEKGPKARAPCGETANALQGSV